MHHHYAINLRNEEANGWDTEQIRENLLGAAQFAQQAQLLMRGVCLTVVPLELHFLYRFTLHVSLEMVSHFTGAFTGRLPWDS